MLGAYPPEHYRRLREHRARWMRAARVNRKRGMIETARWNVAKAREFNRAIVLAKQADAATAAER